jgi:hypothetical protein
VKDNKWV